MNKLMSIQDCEDWIQGGADTEDGKITNTIVEQLADTMRENERLRKALESILDYEAYGCGCNSVAKEALQELQHKHSEIRNHQWDTSVSGDYRCCFCGTRAPYGETDLACTKT